MDILFTIAAMSLAVMLTVFVSLRKNGAPGALFFSFGCFFALLSLAGVLLAEILPARMAAPLTALMMAASCLMIFSGMSVFLGRSSPSMPAITVFIAALTSLLAILESTGTPIASAEIGTAAACGLLAATGITLFRHWPRHSDMAPYLLFCIILFFTSALLNGASLAADPLAGSNIWAQNLRDAGLLGMAFVFLGLILMLHGWMIAGLRKLVARDDLTGAYSRRTFLERAETLHSLMMTLGRPMAFLLLDIDRFKQINDLYGHAGGDRALAHFTRVVEACLAGRGIIGRLGGEEFGVAVRFGGRIEVAELAETICREVRSKPATLENGTAVALTVSIGITLAEHNRTLSEIMVEADTALYEAKATGRDRFCMADSFPGPASASARALAGAAAQLRQAAEGPPSIGSLSETG